MKTTVRWYLLLILSVLLLSCDNTIEDTSRGEDEILPGKEYGAQGKYNLNVIYFIPSDLDTLPRWHKRLSGVTLYVQEFFRQNMRRYGLEKTFNLELNKANPKYIKMLCIRSDKSSSELDSAGLITHEIKEYFRKNPSELASNHFLIYMPTSQKSLLDTRIEESVESSGVYDYGMTVFGHDMEYFDMRHIISDRARKRFLPHLGYLMKYLGFNFFLQENGEKALDPFYSLMGPNIQYFIGTTGNNGIVGNPENFGLVAADAMSLSELQIFNNQDRVYYQERPRVTVDKLDLELKNDSLVCVTCEYRTTDEVVGVIVYNDFWRAVKMEAGLPVRDEEGDKAADTRTASDAMSYLIEGWQIQKEGDVNKITLEFSWEKHVPMKFMMQPGRPYTTPPGAEFRLRFIMKDGVFVPHVGDKNVKGYPTFRCSYRIDRVKKLPDFSVENEIK